jgi:hypothetical protein
MPRAEGCRERDADNGAICDKDEADRYSGSTFSLPCRLAFASGFACGFELTFTFAFALDSAAATRIAVSFARATAAESPLAGVSDNADNDEDDEDDDEEDEEDEETTDDVKFPSDDFGRRFDANGDAAPNAASACGDNADDEDENPCTAPADSGRLLECTAEDGESRMAEAGR